MRTPPELPTCGNGATSAPFSVRSTARSKRARRSQFQAGSRRPNRRPAAENGVAVTGCVGGCDCACLPAQSANTLAHSLPSESWPRRSRDPIMAPPALARTLRLRRSSLPTPPGAVRDRRRQSGALAPTPSRRPMTGARGMPHRPRKCDHLIVPDEVIQFATRVAKIAGLSPDADRIGTGFTPIVGAGYGRRRIYVAARSDHRRKNGAANRPRFGARIRQHVLPISAVLAMDRIFPGCVSARGPRTVARYKTPPWR